MVSFWRKSGFLFLAFFCLMGQSCPPSNPVGNTNNNENENSSGPASFTVKITYAPGEFATADVDPRFYIDNVKQDIGRISPGQTITLTDVNCDEFTEYLLLGPNDTTPTGGGRAVEHGLSKEVTRYPSTVSCRWTLVFTITNATLYNDVRSWTIEQDFED